MGDRVLVVCSGGGHLTEAIHLVRGLDDLDEVQWATPESGQSDTLLVGETLWPIAAIGPRQLGATLALVPYARRLIKRLAPTLVISTGAAPAIPFLLAAVAQRIPAHYVESVTRIDGPSLTGRLLAKVPAVRCYSQHASFGGRWRQIGSPFDGYRVEVGAAGSAPIRRAVVTLGTMRAYPFRSLVERLVQILPAEAEVLWQTGHTDVADLPISAHQLVPMEHMRAAMAEADVIIGHAGCGTALDALASGHVPVLVPRRSARGEHVDDHQAQLARYLDDRGLVVMAEADDLSLDHLQRAANATVEPLVAAPLSLAP